MTDTTCGIDDCGFTIYDPDNILFWTCRDTCTGAHAGTEVNMRMQRYRLEHTELFRYTYFFTNCSTGFLTLADIDEQDPENKERSNSVYYKLYHFQNPYPK